MLASMYRDSPSPGDMQLSVTTHSDLIEDPSVMYGGMCGIEQNSNIFLSDALWKSPTEVVQVDPNPFMMTDSNEMLGNVDADTLFKQIAETIDFHDPVQFRMASPSLGNPSSVMQPISTSPLSSPPALHGKGKTSQDFPRWTKHEDSLLTRVVNSTNKNCRDEGKMWESVAEKINNRDAMQCALRWKTTLNPHLIKAPWTQQEDQTLAGLVEKHGEKNWTLIARHVQGRLGRDCRDRWVSTLNKKQSIRRLWTAEESQILVVAHAEVGHNWSEINKLLPNRTESQIKNHWHSMNRNRSRKDGRSSKTTAGTRKRKSEGSSDSLTKQIKISPSKNAYSKPHPTNRSNSNMVTVDPMETASSLHFTNNSNHYPSNHHPNSHNSTSASTTNHDMYTANNTLGEISAQFGDLSDLNGGIELASNHEMEQYPHHKLCRTIPVMSRHPTPHTATILTSDHSDHYMASPLAIPISASPTRINSLGFMRNSEGSGNKALLPTGLYSKPNATMGQGLHQILGPLRNQPISYHNNVGASSTTTPPPATAQYPRAVSRTKNTTFKNSRPLGSDTLIVGSQRQAQNLNAPSASSFPSTKTISSAIITNVPNMSLKPLPSFTSSIASDASVLKPNPRRDALDGLSQKVTVTALAPLKSGSLRNRRGFGPIHVIDPETILQAALRRAQRKREQKRLQEEQGNGGPIHV